MYLRLKCGVGVVLAAIVLTLACWSTSAAEGGQGGAGGAGGGGGGAGGAGSVIKAPEVSEAKLKAVESRLTDEQKKLLDEMFALEAAQNVNAKLSPEMMKEHRQQMFAWMVNMSAEEQSQMWDNCKARVRQVKLERDPFVELDGAASAKPIPELDNLLSDDIATYLKARKSILRNQPEGARSAIAKLGRSLPPDSTKRVRLMSILQEVEQNNEAERERLITVAEAGFKRLTQIKSDRKDKPNIDVVIARKITSITGRNETPLYDDLCYFSFPKRMHGYKGAVSMMFNNGGGDSFDTTMYGGQENRIKDLGAVDIAGVKSAPPSAITEEWEEGAKAVVGHVYIEHCLEDRDNVDACFKFKVIDLKPGEYVIIEWASIPQDK
jgi:hypothetical protein